MNMPTKTKSKITLAASLSNNPTNIVFFDTQTTIFMTMQSSAVKQIELYCLRFD